MGWEKRNRGRQHYYTRSRKVNGQVIREYVGTGPIAELAAEMDALERRRREEGAETRRIEREHLKALDAPVAKLCEDSETLARATLVASGYRRHDRGEWRKRRVSIEKRSPAAGTPAETNQEDDSLASVEETREFLQRAESGDESVLPALKKLMDAAPELVRGCGDLARQAEKGLVLTMYSRNLLMQEAVARQLEAMRLELSGPSNTPLEGLLVERVVMCWLALQHAELLLTQNGFGGVHQEQVEFHQRRLDCAHRRFLTATRTLAQIRKLKPSVTQVNIAEKQINVAQ